MGAQAKARAGDEISTPHAALKTASTENTSAKSALPKQTPVMYKSDTQDNTSGTRSH